MNTPTHAVLNAALLARGGRRDDLAAVIAGAVLPDVALYVLFVVATFVWRQPQARTWGTTYFEPGWQHAVDALHSFPLLGAALALTVAATRGRPSGRATRWGRWVTIALVSATFHAVGDFLVHAEDAHYHLWPLSDWRFVSPVSYWDPRHHGLVFVPLECVGALALLPTVWRATTRPLARAALAALAVVYAGGAILGATRLVAGRGERPGSLQGAVTGRS